MQLLYLESLRLRTRDLPSLKFFKETLEDKLGLKTEEGAGAFSLVKHTLLVLLGILYFAWFADGSPGMPRSSGRPCWPSWLTMVAVAYALPQLLYRRTSGHWLLPLVPAAARARAGRAPVRGAARVLPVAGRSHRRRQPPTKSRPPRPKISKP